MTALTITRPGRREVAGVGLVAVVLAVVALVAVADFPTGEHRAEGVVRSGARLAARADVADVEVLLTVDAGELVAIVAYQGEKGWLGVDLEPVPTGDRRRLGVDPGRRPCPRPFRRVRAGPGRLGPRGVGGRA